jgi:hypothetical protein
MFALIIAAIVLFVALFIGALEFKKHEKMLGTEGAAQAVVSKFSNDLFVYFAASAAMLALTVFGCSLGLLACVFPTVVFAMTTQVIGGELVQFVIAKLTLRRSAKRDAMNGFVAA